MFRPVPPSRSRPGGYRRGVVSILALATALLASWGAESASAEGRRVVVVSDSILLGARAPLGARLQNAGWSVTFDGAVSRTTLNGVDVVRSHVGELTDTLVVSLGANDSGNPATFRQRVEAVMAAAASVPNVYWLTIREVRPYYGPANQVLREAASRHRNLHLVDWNAASAGRGDLTVGDGLHLSGSGSELLGALVATTLTGSEVPAVAAPAATPPAAAAPTVPATAPSVTLPPSVPAPAPTPTTATAVDGSPIDRSVFVAPLGTAAAATGRSALPGGLRSRTLTGSSSGPWSWMVLVVVSALGLVVLGRRLGFPGASGPVLHAEISRSELRRARLAEVRTRHPSNAAVTPPPRERIELLPQQS